MRHITFIGSLDSTFASKWREKLTPLQVNSGKELSYIISRKKKELPTYWNPVAGDSFLLDDKVEENTKKYLQNRAGISRFDKNINKYFIDPLEDDKTFRPIFKKQRLERLRKNRENRILEKNNSSPPKQNVGNVKVAPNNTPLLKPSKPTLGGKKLPLGKIGLGAVGLATAGALGYGLLRKTRNDKGKKRGRYRK